MSQITHGLRAALSSPLIYDSFQNIMGASRVRSELVNEFIRPQPKARILDIGCGTAEILNFLPADIEYCGYDISPEYISAAQRQFGNRGGFHCGLFDPDAAGRQSPFDIVLVLGVLHHIDDDVVRSLLSLAASVLSPTGRLITIDPCYADGQNPIARFLISRDRGQNVRSAEAYEALASSVFPQVHGTLRYRAWIPYTHWIMECSN